MSLQWVNEERIDYNLIEQLIIHIDQNYEDGAILVFLPGDESLFSQLDVQWQLGMYEINAVYDRLNCLRQFEREWLIRLHSSLTPEEQSRAFAIPPKRVMRGYQNLRPTIADYIDQQTQMSTASSHVQETESEKRIRKVVISTNIAETSLTIGDVVYVIDSGKLRERHFDASRGISALEEGWISQASAKQRKGRAGRVRDGFAFCLYTRHRYTHKMAQFQVPEILRMPLEEIILQIHALQLGRSGKFLETLPQPPDARATELAVKNLTQIGALEPEVEALTPLGRILSTLPIDARIGIAFLAGSVGSSMALSREAVAMGERSIFNTSPDAQTTLQQIKRKFTTAGDQLPFRFHLLTATSLRLGPKNVALGQQSDHLLIIAAFHGWLELRMSGNAAKAHSYAMENLLHEPTLEIICMPSSIPPKRMRVVPGELRAQFAEILAQAKLITDQEPIWNIEKEETSMIRALLVASMYPNVCTLESAEAHSLYSSPYWSDGQHKVELHKSSVNSDLAPVDHHYPFLVYLEKVKTHGIMIRDATVVSPIALLLFGGNLHVQHRNNLIVIDNRIRIRAATPVAVMFKKLRLALDDLILKKVKDPESGMEAEDQVLDIVKTLLKDEEHSRKKRN